MWSRGISCEGPDEPVLVLHQEAPKFPWRTFDFCLFMTQRCLIPAQTFGTGYIRHIYICSRALILQLSQHRYAWVGITFTYVPFSAFYALTRVAMGRWMWFFDFLVFICHETLSSPRLVVKEQRLPRCAVQVRPFPSPDAACAFSTV